MEITCCYSCSLMATSCDVLAQRTSYVCFMSVGLDSEQWRCGMVIEALWQLSGGQLADQTGMVSSAHLGHEMADSTFPSGNLYALNGNPCSVKRNFATSALTRAILYVHCDRLALIISIITFVPRYFYYQVLVRH